MTSAISASAGSTDPMVPDLTMMQPALAIAGAVHDLGNLIQVASSAVNIVARNADMPAAHRKPMLDRARSSLEQAGALAREAIGLVRGRVAPSEAADVTDSLREVAVLFDARNDTDLLLHVQVEAELPAVRCNPLGLQCAILNLLINARDATIGRGSVSVVGTAIRAGTTVTAVEIAVEDRGIGMSPDTIRRALDPFFTTKSDGVGGIGLAMVERFVREAGGSITIDSELGLGTKIAIRLPASNQPDCEPWIAMT